MFRKLSFLLLCHLLVLGLAGCGGVAPQYRVDGSFRAPDCPPSPNCVSSMASRAEQRVPMLAPAPSPEELQHLLGALPRTRIVYQGADFTHATVTSLIFRFRDDLLFWPDAAGDGLHVRSASRLGYSDFGANRRHVQLLLERWQSLQDSGPR